MKASSRKPMFMPSTMGRSPVMAAPMPMPMKPFSASKQARAAGAHVTERESRNRVQQWAPSKGAEKRDAPLLTAASELSNLARLLQPLSAHGCSTCNTATAAACGTCGSHIAQPLTADGRVEHTHVSILLVQVVCDLVAAAIVAHILAHHAHLRFVRSSSSTGRAGVAWVLHLLPGPAGLQGCQAGARAQALPLPLPTAADAATASCLLGHCSPWGRAPSPHPWPRAAPPTAEEQQQQRCVCVSC